MKLLLRFLISKRGPFMLLGSAFAALTVTLALVGCGVPAWLTDASSILALVGSSFASITSFIAGLTGNAALSTALAVVSKWITTVQTGITDLTALITQYQ